MKRYVAIVTLLVGCVLHAAESSTNLLSIQLMDGKLVRQFGRMDGTGRSNELKPISPPVLTDSDFVSFDVANQSFVVTAGAAKRLAKSIWDLGKRDPAGWGDAPTVLGGGVYELIPKPTRFVLNVLGEPIYAGAFYTLTSSSSFPGVVILSDVPFIGVNSISNVTFRIELGHPATFPVVGDPRRDSRIVLAVQKLFTREKK